MTFRSLSRCGFSPEIIAVTEDDNRLSYYERPRSFSPPRRENYVDSNSPTSVANFVARVRNDIRSEKIRVRSKIQDLRYNRLALERNHNDMHRNIFEQHDDMLTRLRMLEDELEFNVNECLRLQTELDRVQRKQEWNDLQSESRKVATKSKSNRSRSRHGTRRSPINV